HSVRVLIMLAMRSFAKDACAAAMALSLSLLPGCMTPAQNSPRVASGPAQMGSSGGTAYQPSSAGSNSGPVTPLPDAVPDPGASRALTDYLKSHRLPLVSAQVMQAPDGRRQVILSGFVGTNQGKTDAQGRANRFVNDPQVSVDNRIKVEPELVKSEQAAQPSEADQNASTGDLQQYQNQQDPDAYQQSQIYQYQNQYQGPYGSTGPSALGAIVPFLSMFGGS